MSPAANLYRHTQGGSFSLPPSLHLSSLSHSIFSLSPSRPGSLNLPLPLPLTTSLHLALPSSLVSLMWVSIEASLSLSLSSPPSFSLTVSVALSIRSRTHATQRCHPQQTYIRTGRRTLFLSLSPSILSRYPSIFCLTLSFSIVFSPPPSTSPSLPGLSHVGINRGLSHSLSLPPSLSLSLFLSLSYTNTLNDSLYRALYQVKDACYAWMPPSADMYPNKQEDSATFEMVCLPHL